ncbi:Holliday junction branch migration protein RuvA [Cereibacter azotoformans]|uniref:Holliday junction branch migration complex subunit RuvA n=1 Tax=Cereibacter azotoformans TaxID=43057 RepID=A0A2T5K8Z4_9RHOB|nr:Holliday junction branch migration protein RuvA [Cereibacter azotoformans]AXQ93371.1 Holliday junction branch migration protein RuvA [Cereibacter sphaeroides]MBO4168958.1 Holliday junction branch migration protein RuvA [Cereibacter azotoformans]PTR18890.1 Holliday junction DNA helicase subunit RuvA [Cereibacter azotoformans]UIJ31693.1 Holliday junction branch migration protein RuvA [Cereibacter azotoformans]
MIGKISGILDFRGPDHVLIDVRGVGYIVHVSDRTLAAMPAPGEGVALYTELVVREDLLQLFGFTTMIEKEWHRMLMTVQGVGAKAGMAILGALGAEGVARAISLGDARSIQAAPGVGPKIAQRVVLELKSKAPALMVMGGAAPARAAAVVEETPQEPAPRRKPSTRAAPPPAANHTGDALSALTNLGYQPSDAAQAVAQASGDNPQADAAALIRAALKLLAPRS